MSAIGATARQIEVHTDQLFRRSGIAIRFRASVTPHKKGVDTLSDKDHSFPNDATLKQGRTHGLLLNSNLVNRGHDNHLIGR